MRNTVSKELHKAHHLLCEQLHSTYFNPSFISFVSEFSLVEGILLFYCTETIPFSLGVALLDNQHPNLLLWKRDEPIWRTSEKIKPLKIEKNGNEFIFCFKLSDKEYSIRFFLDEIFGKQKKAAFSLFQRAINNPILKPQPEHAWESAYVFNPAVLYLEGKVHLIYRAIGDSGISVLGYAASSDGVSIDERLAEPIYTAQNLLEDVSNHLMPSQYQYASGGSWSGCEDPRIVKIGDTIYMTYTVFDGYHPQRIALTSISVNDFLNKRWHWRNPVLISVANEVNKNWVLFPELLNGKYAILHSITPRILIDYFDTLNFDKSPNIKSQYYSHGRDLYWDNWIRGVGPPPLKTAEGWLVLYHAMDNKDPNRYKIGGLILDENDPTKILYRSAQPLMAPDAKYENDGYKAGVIYTCGAIIKDNKLFIYYGGADTVICAAYADLNDVLAQIKNLNPIQIETAIF